MMIMERKSLVFFLLLLIFLASQEMIMPSEAIRLLKIPWPIPRPRPRPRPRSSPNRRFCKSRSHKFQGTCVRGNDCGLVCKNEGFYGGNCQGFPRRCFCIKIC